MVNWLPTRWMIGSAEGQSLRTAAELVVWVLVLVLGVLIFGVMLFQLRRRLLKQKRLGSKVGFSLDELEYMHKRGELSGHEYRMMREVVIGQNLADIVSTDEKKEQKEGM